MKIRTMEIELSTAGNDDVVDITAAVEARIGEAGIIEGTVIVFVPGSTGGSPPSSMKAGSSGT